MATDNRVMRRRALAAMLALSGAACLALGVPRLMAELSLVPGTPYLRAVQAGETLSEDDILLLEQSRLNALELVPLPSAYANLAYLSVLRAQRADTPEERERHASKAENLVRESLKGSPVNPYYWLTLSSALILQGKHLDGITAWKNSLATAPFDPPVILERIHVGMLMLNYMNEDDIAALRAQIEMAYRWHRGLLQRYVRRNRLAPMIEYLMSENAELVEHVTQ